MIAAPRGCQLHGRVPDFHIVTGQSPGDQLFFPLHQVQGW